MKDARRTIPGVGGLLETPGFQALIEEFPRSVVLDSLRQVLDEARRSTRDLSNSSLEMEVREAAVKLARPTLRRLINATGVVLHTNLGRAPLAPAAIAAVSQYAAGYGNLEYDLDEGKRGSRYSHCVSQLKALTGAEDAIVVNNCAAALLLSLSTLASGKDAIVSRGELVEIGGSFRIPDIMRASGAHLLEVGTTNRTHLEDYVRAMGPRTGAVVKVHRSNFTIEGFVAEVKIDRLAPVAAEHGIPVIHDLGSGLLISLESIGLTGEPIAGEVVRAGATLVLMSGDKLLGGPQAGIIVGKSAAVAQLKTNPLARALRVDKLTIAALSATLELYRDPRTALREVPTLAMLGATLPGLEARAERIRDALCRQEIESQIVPSAATVGAGAFPTAQIESRALALGGRAEEIERSLRACSLPVIGRIEDGRFLLDMRSVMPDEDDLLLDSLVRSLK